MRPLKESLLDYLENFTGERPELTPKSAAKLPLFLRARYEFHIVRLFGRSFLLALASNKHTSVSPGEYAAEAESIFGVLGEPVVLVLPVLPSHARNRLVQKSMPFIVPGSQLFLPTAVIDLRERQPRPRAVTGKKLTPAAQCLVLYQLLREPFNQLLGEHPTASSLREVARRIGYSPIMLTKVKAELESAGLCEEVRQGRATLLRFLFEDQELWEHALPWLSPPQRAQRWVRWELPPQPALLAGLSALAQRTVIQ
ncbi:MAG: hypothetical protein MUC50_20390, partial [Myxococcota bacterium]|nr:hypothetical protein [Myxococcota bacterium]